MANSRRQGCRGSRCWCAGRSRRWRARARPPRRRGRDRLRRELHGAGVEPQQHLHRRDADDVQLPDAAAILTASNWKPGDTSTGTVDIANTGSLAGHVHAQPLGAQQLGQREPDCPTRSTSSSRTAATSPAARRPADAGDPVKYSGTLTAMTSNVALGHVRREREAPVPVRSDLRQLRRERRTRAPTRRRRSAGTRSSSGLTSTSSA